MTAKQSDQNVIRCGWCGDDPIYMDYHDNEWGKGTFDEGTLFEFLLLESVQAGLSWITILRRREGYREAFANFDVEKVAQFDDKDIERLVNNARIIRHRLKIESTVSNARLFIEVQKEFGSFDSYIRSFLPEGKRIVNYPKELSDVPATTDVSDRISKDMKKRGFKFFGSTICYAFLQAVGYVDDHLVNCSFKTR